MFKLFILISLISIPLFSKSRVEIFARVLWAKIIGTNRKLLGDGVGVCMDNSFIKG